MTDMAVVRQAYVAGTAMHASAKVMLALFEAGIVESGFENLPGGDRDSVGFLQQRASQGWTGLTDVTKATQEFVIKAQRVESQYSTAGQLAQAVQISAFPLKYDAVRAQAATLLAAQSGSGVAASPTGLDLTGNPLTSATDALTKLVDTISDPHMWIRVGLFVGGFVAILIALLKLTETSAMSIVKKVA